MCEVVYNVQDTTIWVCRNYTKLELSPIRVPSPSLAEPSSSQYEPSPSSLQYEPSPSSSRNSSMTTPSSTSRTTVCPTCPTQRPCNLRPSPRPICNCNVGNRTNATHITDSYDYDTNNLWWFLLLPLLFVCVFCVRRRCCARLRVGISRNFRKYGMRSRSWPNRDSREIIDTIPKAKSFNGFDSIVI